jgi:hypothetical protein
VAVLVVAGIAAFAVGRDSGGSDSEPKAEAAIDHPDEWDARIVPVVEFVEEERGLAFEHPVAVDFLTEDEWREQADIDEEEILDEDAQLLEHGAGLFRAVGLAEGDLDLLSDTEELGASGTVGFYSFEDQAITVRGADITPKIEATLAHELTHVLQDQHFDIGDRLEAVAEEDTAEESLRVLVEGDADRIEDLWVEALSEEDRAALDAERAEESTTADEALDELPASLVAFFASDYILGGGFMDILEAADGETAIDDAFDEPPGPDEHVSDPISFLEDDEPSEVDPPDVDGERIEDFDGDFGSVSWYLMLAERTDPVAALAAVDGWGGDQFRAYRNGDRTCAALRFVGEDEDAGVTMEAALTSWAAAMPDEADVTVAREGDQVDVVTCDPGTDAELLGGEGRSRETISLFAIRSTIAADVLAGGGTNDQARCFSRGIIANLDYETLITSEPTPAQQAEIEEVAAAQGVACR